MAIRTFVKWPALKALLIFHILDKRYGSGQRVKAWLSLRCYLDQSILLGCT
jgi:hypothetical protein